MTERRYIPVNVTGRRGRWEIQDRAKERTTVARFMSRTLAEKVCRMLNTERDS